MYIPNFAYRALLLLLGLMVLVNAKAFAVEEVASQPSSSQAEWRYSVRSGDSLIHFSRQHLINPDDWRTLQKLNKIQSPHRMRMGQILRVPLHLVKQLPAPAKVVLSSGYAGILKADKSIVPVSAGQQLTAGTELVTGEKSKLNIQFADGSIVSMQPNSQLKLDTLSIYSGGGMVDTTLRLQQGKLETEANPAHVQGNKMQIITPTAVAAVRGTKFRVSADDDSITQETLEGKVALIAAGAEVTVDKGYGSLSEGGAAPLQPILLLPAPSVANLPVKLDTVPVVFNIPAQDGAVAWLGKVSRDAQFNTIATENVSQGTHLSLNDLPDGKYYLKVRAKDNKGLEGYDATHEFSLNARPFAPQSSAPAQFATVREANPVLTWSQVEHVNEYLLELARDADFKQMLDSRRVVNTTYKIEKNLEPGQYYWRLASLENEDQGPYAAANSFTYKAKPKAPDISQLKVQVRNNKVFVNTINAPDGLSYLAVLHNEVNQQKNVWQASTNGGEFNFLLKEYGKQTLSLRLVDAEGVTGDEAIFEFNAAPQ
jgi:hypothetical protein